MVRLDGAIDPADTDRIRAAIWAHLGRKLGAAEDDPTTWPSGWLPISWKSLKRNRAFDVVVANPSVRDALDVIFEQTGWQASRSGAQVLFTLPADGPWTLPDGWHMDGGFERPTWPTFGVKIFTLVGDVGPCGGGTMVLPGVHHLVDRYRSTFEHPPGGGKDNWRPFLRRHPPLGELLQGATMPDGGRSMVERTFAVDGVDVQVQELRGAPGDVVITHLHVFHTVSPNTGTVPRQMVANTVFAGTPGA